MADRQEQEYHFNPMAGEEREVVDVEAAVDGEPSHVDFMKKRIWMIAAGVLTVWVIYSLGSMWFSQPEKTRKNSPPQPIPAPVIQPMPPREDVSKKIESRVAQQLHHHQARASEGMTELRSQLKSLQQEMIELDSKINDIIYGQQQLLVHLDQQKQLLVQINAPPESTTQEKNPAHISYHVKALMHGRAWLVDVNGSTLTVKQGDMLPGYGKVIQIFPDEGLVRLTGDKIITFKADDG